MTAYKVIQLTVYKHGDYFCYCLSQVSHHLLLSHLTATLVILFWQFTVFYPKFESTHVRRDMTLTITDFFVSCLINIRKFSKLGRERHSQAPSFPTRNEILAIAV